MCFRCQLRGFQFVIGLVHVSGMEATNFIRGCKFHTSFRTYTLLNRRRIFILHIPSSKMCEMLYFFVFIVFVKLIQKLILLLGFKTFFFFAPEKKSRLKADKKFKSLVLIESPFSERTRITVIYCRQSSTEVDYRYGLLQAHSKVRGMTTFLLHLTDCSVMGVIEFSGYRNWRQFPFYFAKVSVPVSRR